MKNKLENILHKGECLSEETMRNYIDGKLSSAEMHRVEKHLLECELCNDAMEGLNLFRSKDKIKSTVAALNESINHSTKKKEGIILLLRPYRIAAIIVVCMIFGGGIWLLTTISNSDKVITENIVSDENKTAPAETAKPVDALEEKSETKKEESAESHQQDISGKKKSLKENQQAIAESKLTDKTAERKTETISGDADYSAAAKTLDDKRNDAPSAAAADEEAKNQKSVVTSANSGAESAPESVVQSERKEVETKSAPAKMNRTLSEEKSKSDAMPAQNNISAADTISAATQNNLLEEGIKKYDEKNYSEAISLLEKALSSNSKSDKAKWYLSLAYIKGNKISKAKKLLNELSSGNSSYKSQAEKALLDLK